MNVFVGFDKFGYMILSIYMEFKYNQYTTKPMYALRI